MTSFELIFSLFILAYFPCKTSGIKKYYMDKMSDCGQTLNVYDDGIEIHGRSFNAPSNPLLRCVIYLRSSYTRNDGTNKLQIEVDALDIKDCNIVLNLYSGRRSVGEYLKSFACGRKPSGVIYSTTNEVTVKLERPETLRNTEYDFTLGIKPYKDNGVMGSKESDEKLSIGAIIGIVIGCLVVIGIIILLCWCCCSGRISGFHSSTAEKGGQMNRGLTEEKYKPPAIVLNEPTVWDTSKGTHERYEPRFLPRNMPRNEMGPGMPNRFTNPRPFDHDRSLGQGRNNFGRNGDPYNRYQNRRPDDTYENEGEIVRNSSPKQPRKETLIDDVFDSDTQTSDIDDTTLQKRPIGDTKKLSPKLKRGQSIPEEEEDIKRSPLLQRYKSMDLQSQPDTDTMTSPVHVNAGVRASVEDDLGDSPVGSLHRKSPKSKRKNQRLSDSPEMPPETFEPIFNEPISDINYPRQGYGQMAPQFPGAFMPYGLIPSTVFAPGVPGSQTYAYAYQTAPPGVGGQPSTQGAYVVQNTPTAEGNRRTAFAVEQTVSPGKSSPHGKSRGSDPFGKSPYRDNGNSKKGRNKGKGYAPDLSVVTRGAAPPEPGPGQRSMVLKSGTDPETGIHTAQGVWTDNVPDPTDPEPGVDNPQITRKTITRVTAKSGHGELPPETNPLIGLEGSEPAFLSPSSRSGQAPTPSIMPPHKQSNVDYYTGTGRAMPPSLPETSSMPPPERTSTPTLTFCAPTYNAAIRDRISIDDSTV